MTALTDIQILEVKTCWTVETNSDLTEGRGYQYPLYVCASETTAKRLARKKGVQGCDADVVERLMFKTTYGWRGPIDLIMPSKEDDAIDREKAIVAEQLAKKQAAIEKARALGLSDDDLQALSN